MSWVKMDDGLDDDRDVTRLSHDAFRVFICSITFTRRHQTAGFLTPGDVSTLCRAQRIRSASKVLDQLLWVNPADPNAEPLWVREGEGFRIRGYAKFNPLTSTERMREKRARESNVTSQGVTSDEDVTSHERHTSVTRDVTVTSLARASATGIANTRQDRRLPVPEPVPFNPPGPPLSLSRLTIDRVERLEGALVLMLRRNLKARERSCVLQWAELERNGEPVPEGEILAMVRHALDEPTRDGLPVGSLAYVHDSVLALARGPAPKRRTSAAAVGTDRRALALLQGRDPDE